MSEEALRRVREICVAFPETTENPEGRPTFQVRGKRFAWFMDNHHNDGRLALWIKQPPGAQQELVASDPERFFVPPYVGPSGWIGVKLDVRPDWTEISELLEDGYRTCAPKKLLAAMDAQKD